MRGWVIRGEFFLLPKEIASVDKPAEDQSVTALKGLIKEPENPISVDSMNPLGATKQDRLSQVAVIAEEIFEDKAVAISWMTTVNDALGGKMPIFLCDTEIGARQVLREILKKTSRFW